MSIFSELTKKRKRLKKNRATFMLVDETISHIFLLHEARPEYSASQVVADALRFAIDKGMYGKSLTPHGDNREQWCSMYGGKSDGVNCTYTKYEVTATGDTVKSTRQIPLKSMPETQADFKKEVLGSYPTLDAAEWATRSRGQERGEEKKTKRTK